jgi:PAS domain S-box-containing protein
MSKLKDTGNSDQLRPLKEKIIDTIYLIFGILAVPLAGASIARAFTTGWKWLYSYHIVIAIIPVLVLIFLKRIPYKIKVYVALMILFSDVVMGFLSFGILENAKIFVILIVVLAGLLLGKKQGYYALIFNSLVLIIIAWLYSSQVLQYNFDLSQYLDKVSVWISLGLFLVAISLGLLEIVTGLFKAQSEYSQKAIESEKRFHTIIQQAADAVYLCDMQGRIVEVNQQALIQTGFSRDELLQKTIMDIDSSFPTLETLHSLWDGMSVDESVKTEGKHIKKNGSEFPVEVSISIIELDNGKHSLGFARDISERKKAEEALKASEEKFRKVIEASPVGMAIFDQEMNVQKFNDMFTRLFGYTLEDIPNVNNWFPLAYPDEKYRAEVRQKWDAEIDDFLRNRITFKPIEAHVRCKDGTYREIEFGFEAIRNTFITTFVDLTERKKNEQQLIDNEKKLKEQNEEYLAINEELSESYAKITEINQELEAAIEKAEESEERFRNLSNLTFEGIFLHKDGICLDINLSLEKMTGYSREELIGKDLVELLILPEYHDLAINQLKEEPVKPWEVIIKRKDGSFFDAEIISQSVTWKNERIRVAAARDITDRKKAEKSLLESEEKYKKLVESFPDVVMLSDLKGNILYGNENLEKVMGISADEYNNPHRKPHIHPDDIEIVKNALSELLNGTKTRTDIIENRFIDAFGKTHWMSGTMSRIYLGGELTIQTVSRDVTERKLAEKALQESNEKYKRLANATFEGIGYSHMGQIIETNQRIIEMYGYSEDEFKQLELKDLVHPDDLPVVMDHIRKDDETPYEHRAIRKDGSVFYIEARGKQVEFDNKNMRLTILRDITERKNYEISLAESELKFRNIFNSSSDGILVTDFDQNILAANQIILDLTKMDETQIRTKKISDFVTDKFLAEINKRMEKYKKGRYVSAYEIEIILANNKILPVEINSKAIDFENRKALLTIMRDISERRQMQHKIIQTIIQTEEKERSHFAKELHDGLGPLLSTMKIYTGILQDSSDEERREISINRIQATVDEAILGIRQISNSLSPHVLQNFGLPEAISNFFSKLKDIKNIEFKFKSNLEKRLDNNVELTLFRVIVELINNSVKYSGASLIKITIHLENNILKVDYADNGKGFDVEKTLSNTKSMGLHNIYNRIQSLNGKVNLTSQKGKGMKAGIHFKIR